MIERSMKTTAKSTSLSIFPPFDIFFSLILLFSLRELVRFLGKKTLGTNQRKDVQDNTGRRKVEKREGIVKIKLSYTNSTFNCCIFD